jgi:hypothetical protein
MEDNDTLDYAVSTYGFLLKNGEYTAPQFAIAIAVAYSLDNPQNRAVVDALLRHPEVTITRDHFGASRTRADDNAPGGL